MAITLEQLTHENFCDAQRISRDDIPEAWVDSAATIMETTDYGAAHHLLGQQSDMLPSGQTSEKRKACCREGSISFFRAF